MFHLLLFLLIVMCVMGTRMTRIRRMIADFFLDFHRKKSVKIS